MSTTTMKGIADYTFVRLLGEGNHGQFWLAIAPPRLGLSVEHVAVKTLGQRATDDDFRRMANELRIYAAVDCPYLVTLYDAGHQDGDLYYAAEYLPDGSLANPARPLDRNQVRLAVAHAARAAHALHEVGVSHRDIKPANILLDATTGKLGDLGLAQVINPGQTLTGYGPIGSVEYLAPETIRGDRSSRASDIWALGITLHRVLTGRSVYPHIPQGSLLDSLRHVISERPVIDTSLDGAERSIIEDCLAPDPAARPSTADGLADRIEATVAS